MENINIDPTPATPLNETDLFVLHSQIGLNGLFTEGVFHAVAAEAGSARLFTVVLPLVSTDTAVQGHIDFTNHGLTEPPLLLAFVGGVSPNHTGSCDLFNVSATGADFVARQSYVGAGTFQPLNGTLTVIAIR